MKVVESGGPAVKTPCFHHREHGFIPGWGTKILLAMGARSQKLKKKKEKKVASRTLPGILCSLCSPMFSNPFLPYTLLCLWPNLPGRTWLSSWGNSQTKARTFGFPVKVSDWLILGQVRDHPWTNQLIPGSRSQGNMAASIVAMWMKGRRCSYNRGG